MTSKICLIEDDLGIQELIERGLSEAGFRVESFSNCQGLIEKSQSWELFIVDVLLQGEKKGFEFCQNLRSQNPLMPILILSALSDLEHKIEGFKDGADDYLTKPFVMEELLLRIRAMLRRRVWYQSGSLQNKYQSGSFEINFSSFEAKNKKGNVLKLNQKECMLLKLLIEKKGEVVTRQEILDRVWGYHVFPSTRTVDNFILRLRKYFEQDPSVPKFIQSVRGVGYKWSEA